VIEKIFNQTPFSQEQLDQLVQPLDPKRVKHRAGGGGMQLSYLTGHDAINTANRIFGYGNWGYDLLGVELNTVNNENGEVIGGYYAARVKLIVTGCIPVTEEGVCPVQEGRNPRARIDAHDMARKGAITDALKRALRCYGDQFGNSLYDSDLIDGQPKTGNQNRNVNRPANNSPSSAPQAKPEMAPPALSRPAAIEQPVMLGASGNGNGSGNGRHNSAASTSTPAPAKTAVPSEPATEQQRQAIMKLAERKEMRPEEMETRLKGLYGSGLEGLNKADASHFIKLLQGAAA